MRRPGRNQNRFERSLLRTLYYWQVLLLFPCTVSALIQLLLLSTSSLIQVLLRIQLDRFKAWALLELVGRGTGAFFRLLRRTYNFWLHLDLGLLCLFDYLSLGKVFKTDRVHEQVQVLILLALIGLLLLLLVFSHESTELASGLLLSGVGTALLSDSGGRLVVQVIN